MNRRIFLSNFALGVAGLFLPTRTYFLPPQGGWSLSVPSDQSIALAESLLILARHKKLHWPMLLAAKLIEPEGTCKFYRC